MSTPNDSPVQSNAPDRPPPYLIESAELQREAAAVQSSPVGAFQSKGGRNFNIFVTDQSPIDPNSSSVGDTEALRDGFTNHARIIAIDMNDGVAYAVWQLYTVRGGAPFRSEVLEVDHRHQNQGIGSGMLTSVEKLFSVTYSGNYTKAGAALVNRRLATRTAEG